MAGVLTKAIAADAWTIACWRGLIGGLLVVAYVGLLARRQPTGRAFHFGWRGWLRASVGSLDSVTCILAFKPTYVANVAVFYVNTPFLDAALAWAVLGVRFRPQPAVA